VDGVERAQVGDFDEQLGKRRRIAAVIAGHGGL